jgi:hypothetical protein
MLPIEGPKGHDSLPVDLPTMWSTDHATLPTTASSFNSSTCEHISVMEGVHGFEAAQATEMTRAGIEGGGEVRKPWGTLYSSEGRGLGNNESAASRDLEKKGRSSEGET